MRIVLWVIGLLCIVSCEQDAVIDEPIDPVAGVWDIVSYLTGAPPVEETIDQYELYTLEFKPMKGCNCGELLITTDRVKQDLYTIGRKYELRDSLLLLFLVPSGEKSGLDFVVEELTEERMVIFTEVSRFTLEKR